MIDSTVYTVLQVCKNKQSASIIVNSRGQISTLERFTGNSPIHLNLQQPTAAIHGQVHNRQLKETLARLSPKEILL